MSFWSSPCSACKFLRRKCTHSCVLAPYFPPHEPYKFLCVHRVFGASNMTKILNDISPEQREAAVSALVYEADARIKNPVYGCVGYISLLQQQLVQLRMRLDKARKTLATYNGPAALDPFRYSAPAPAQFHHPQFQGSAPFAEQQMMGLGLATGAATPQPMIWNQSQTQMLVEARRMMEVAASDAAQEQQMFGSYDQQQQQELLRLGCAPFEEQQIMGLGLITGAATPQPMNWNQSQSQMLVEARPMVEVAASDAAQEQQMFSSYDQQQQELLRLSSVHGACGIYNNVEVAASDAAQEQEMLGSYDQQQQQELLRLSNVEQLGGGVTVAVYKATESAGGLSLHPPSHHLQNLLSSTPSKEM